MWANTSLGLIAVVQDDVETAREQYVALQSTGYWASYPRPWAA